MTERRADRWIVLAFVAIFCFGYSFHELWLLYDVACVWSALQLLGPRVEPRVRRLAGWLVVLVAGWFAISASLHDTGEMWALGIWDTLKHVFLWLYLLRGLYGASPVASPIHSDALYRLCSIAFVVDCALSVYQWASGELTDNVDGLFGPSATHSFGYFMVFYFLLSYRRGESGVRLAAILVVAAGVALIGESMGFFILLPLWFVVSVVDSRRSGGSIAAAALAIAAIAIVLAKTQPEFVDSLISRAVTVVQPDEAPTPDKPINGRGTAIAYASLVGGWTGDGPGTYSQIYGRDGSGAWLLEVVQIDICELSHLLAEWGGLGVGYVVGIFALLYAAMRVSFVKRAMLFALFALTLLHGQLLMDERLIFFEMLTVLCLLYDPAAPPQRDQDPRGTEREAEPDAGHHDLAAARA
ncbi:MAG: hypothetical protein ABJE66_22435 [Deltaproteobacteria bacterium]